MTWFESGWHLSVVVPAQPHFADLPEVNSPYGVMVLKLTISAITLKK
jgi:myosin-crossreactive antigen